VNDELKKINVILANTPCHEFYDFVTLVELELSSIKISVRG